jgi:ureidoacrylate peracid hydrolase
MDTAVLVIDMQNGFVHPDGSIPSLGTPLPRMAEVIEENRRMIATARGAGVPIVYTRHQWREGYPDVPTPVLARFAGRTDILVEGTWDAAVCDALTPEPRDVLIDKRRYDAFLYTDMELILRSLGAKRLLVSGVVTNICVESTVRAAHMRDFDVFVASDCTSAAPEFHEPSLVGMAAVFATVLPWREALSELVSSSELLAEVH